MDGVLRFQRRGFVQTFEKLTVSQSSLERLGREPLEDEVEREDAR